MEEISKTETEQIMYNILSQISFVKVYNVSAFIHIYQSSLKIHTTVFEPFIFI